MAMTEREINDALRGAKVAGLIAAWSNPGPDTWYMQANYGPTAEIDRPGIERYVEMLRADGVEPVKRSDQS